MNGFNFLSDMTREELIDEIMENQREIAQTYSDDQLKAAVIEYRVNATRRRLEAEAGIKVTRGLFGDSITSEDGE